MNDFFIFKVCIEQVIICDYKKYISSGYSICNIILFNIECIVFTI